MEYIIRRRVVSASALEWLIRYIYYYTVPKLCNYNQNKSSPPLGTGYLADFGYPLVLLLLNTFIMFWRSNLSILSMPDEGYSRNASCALQ